MTDWCTVRHSLLLRHHLLPFLDLPASLIAMAMAWRRDLTLGPVLLPECSLPRLNSCMTFSTLSLGIFASPFFSNNQRTFVTITLTLLIERIEIHRAAIKLASLGVFMHTRYCQHRQRLDEPATLTRAGTKYHLLKLVHA